LIGQTIMVPPALADLLNRPSHTVEIEPTLSALKLAASVRSN